MLRRPTHGVLPAALILTAIIAAARPSGAQSADPATAQALFAKARAELERGNLEAACTLFDESYRLEHAVGTLLNSAHCNEQRGRLATALSLYRKALELLEAKDPRKDFARNRIQALDARIPRLTLMLRSDAPRGTKVARDGIALGPPSMGVALPVDPGKHVIRVEAPGHAARSYEVTLEEAGATSLEVAPGRAAESARAVDTGAAGDSGSARRSAGYVAGSVGVVGLAFGITTGLLREGKQSTIDAHCDASKRCDQEGLDAVDSARSLWTMSMIGWGVGLAGVSAGAYLLLSSDSDEPESTAIAPAPFPHGAGVVVHRRFW